MSLEAARWLDGRKHNDIQVFVRQFDNDKYQVDSVDEKDNRATVLFPAWKIEELAKLFGMDIEPKRPSRYEDRKATFVSLCNGSRVPSYPESCREIGEIDGRVHVWMYEPRVSESGIALTDRTGSRPEVGRIVGGRDDGKIVAVRPYAGYWIPGEWGEIRSYGVQDDLEDVILMEWRERSWHPLHDWLVVDREPLLFHPGKFMRQGLVRMAGPDSSASVGDGCVWGLSSEKERKGFVLRLEEWGSRTGSFFGPETVLVWDGCAASWKES